MTLRGQYGLLISVAEDRETVFAIVAQVARDERLSDRQRLALADLGDRRLEVLRIARVP